MSKHYRDEENLFDDPENLEQPYRVIVQFILKAEDPEQAQSKINDLIKEGILAMAPYEEKDIRYDYDITDCEIAEIDME